MQYQELHEEITDRLNLWFETIVEQDTKFTSLDSSLSDKDYLAEIFVLLFDSLEYYQLSNDPSDSDLKNLDTVQDLVDYAAVNMGIPIENLEY